MQQPMETKRIGSQRAGTAFRCGGIRIPWSTFDDVYAPLCFCSHLCFRARRGVRAGLEAAFLQISLSLEVADIASTCGDTFRCGGISNPWSTIDDVYAVL